MRNPQLAARYAALGHLGLAPSYELRSQLVEQCIELIFSGEDTLAWGARGRVFESLRPDQITPENPVT
ncbi:hypothetical protein EMIT053CA3_130003 [Pseudomonas donghuensis]